MARKTARRAKRRARQASTRESDDGLLDVTVVLLKDGYSSTAIAPIEIFHSAGVVWNWLHGEAVRPRFRVRTASIDGRKVSAAGSLGLIPDCAINDVKQTDIIIVSAPAGSCWTTSQKALRSYPGCENGMHAAPTSLARAQVLHSLRKAEFSMADRQPPIGASLISIASAIPRFAGAPSNS